MSVSSNNINIIPSYRANKVARLESATLPTINDKITDSSLTTLFAR